MTDATKPAGDLVQRLRQERRPTAWTRGLDTDYPTAWEPNLLCHEAADEIDRLTAALKKQSRAHHIEVQEQVAAALADRERAIAEAAESHRIALREWAVSKWRAEVEHRPLVNLYRRSLDDTWRQVMRYAGLDPDDAVGPSHDELHARSGAKG